jgi:hypothetical protein
MSTRRARRRAQVVAQVIEQGRLPVVARTQRRFGRHQPERIDVGHDAAHARHGSRAAGRDRNDGEGAAEAGNVEGLGGRQQGDGARREFRAQSVAKESVAAIRREHQAVVDFVRTNHEVVLFRQRAICHNSSSFHTRPVGLCGWQSWNSFALLRFSTASTAGKSHSQPAESRTSGTLTTRLPEYDGRRKKGRIDRRRGEHRVARLSHRPAGDIEAGHQTRQPDDPFRTRWSSRTCAPGSRPPHRPGSRSAGCSRRCRGRRAAAAPRCTAGGAAKSMSATQSGTTSPPEYFAHFTESVPARSTTRVEVEAHSPVTFGNRKSPPSA